MSNGGRRALIDTVRLNAKDRRKLLERLERGNSDVSSASNRRGLRVDFPINNAIVSLSTEGSDTVKCAVQPRNLARRGMAFIHGRFIYPDTTCGVILPTLMGEWVQVTGKVLRCRHVEGVIHEVSVTFDEAVDLTWFVELSDEQAQVHMIEQQADADEHVCMANPQAKALQPIDGNALLLAGDLGARMSTARNLRRTGLTVHEIAALSEFDDLDTGIPWHAVLLDITDKSVGLSALSSLRDLMGNGKPMIVIGPDNADETRATALAEGAAAFFPKPLNLDELAMTLRDLIQANRKKADGQMVTDSGELIDKPTDSQAIVSSKADDPDVAPMLPTFVDQLRDYQKTLLSAVQNKDAELLERTCNLMTSGATSYGFGPVAYVAKTTMEIVQQRKGNWDAIDTAVNELIAVLQRVEC